MITGHGDDAYQYPGIVSDFSSNICAHAPHQRLMEHLTQKAGLISHYPEPEAWSLERLVAERYAIDPACVVVTNGATEAIYLVAQTFPMAANIPQPTFSEYEDACAMFPPATDGRQSLWLCNPNNPTGSVLAEDMLEPLLESYDLIVVDQSYEDYTPHDILSPRQAIRHEKIVQIHSMTKTYGVPGLRLGYITASASLARLLRMNLRPWSVSALAVECGLYLLQHDELRLKPDFAEAQRLWHELNQLDGVSVRPTDTNFMLCHMDNHTAADLKDYLVREHGILIRDASNFRGLTPGHFRVATQTPAENDALVSAINQFLEL